MATQDKLPIKSVVSFTVYPTAVLNSKFSNVKVLGVIDSSMARDLGTGVDELHANVFSSLPVGTPNDPDAYLYVRIEFPNGQRQILGLPWIKESSIVVSNYTVINAKISGVQPADWDQILALLGANGYNQVELTAGN
jgi:hypothetical protein